jgi:hypothetical protein
VPPVFCARVGNREIIIAVVIIRHRESDSLKLGHPEQNVPGRISRFALSEAEWVCPVAVEGSLTICSLDID